MKYGYPTFFFGEPQQTLYEINVMTHDIEIIGQRFVSNSYISNSIGRRELISNLIKIDLR